MGIVSQCRNLQVLAAAACKAAQHARAGSGGDRQEAEVVARSGGHVQHAGQPGPGHGVRWFRKLDSRIRRHSLGLGKKGEGAVRDMRYET